MLLEIDGLDEAWDGMKVPTSDSEGDLGDLEEEDVPEAVRRALNPSQIRAYDTTIIGAADREEDEERVRGVSTGPTLDEDEDDVDRDIISVEEDTLVSDSDGDGDDTDVRVVHHLSQKFFRDRLVEHFNIVFRGGGLTWPKRRGAAPAITNV